MGKCGIKRWTVLGLLLIIFMCERAYAQTVNDEYERFKQEVNALFDKTAKKYNSQFESFRAKINKEFATFLEKEWKLAVIDEPAPSPVKPEPEFERPTQGNRMLPNKEPLVRPFDTIAPAPLHPIKSAPIVPLRLLPDNEVVVVVPKKVIQEEPVIPVATAEYTVNFEYLENRVQIRFPEDSRIQLGDIDKGNLSKAWKDLSGEQYNAMLVDCLAAKESLQLCDWAFYQFLLAFTKQAYGDEQSPSAIITQAYIFSQLGYKIRLASTDNNLHILFSYKDDLFDIPYFKVGGDKFYAFTLSPSSKIQFCDFTFPGEHPSTAVIRTLPIVPANKSDRKEFKSEKNKDLVVSVETNNNLMEFYNNYPACKWNIKVEASLSDDIKEQLYPSLSKAIQGKNDGEAANILIDFVQTAFQYQRDDEQFGREKAFFGDELFFYPYSDCEDRSVLYAILIKELLMLDVVLLEYPTHIATAVKFKEDVTGDYFMIDGEKYIVCDPTYIGATIGESMESMRQVGATIIRIN